MNILEIIGKKRDGLKLNKEEIEFFIENYTNNNITDYQASALIMAIYINGMDEEETTFLTMAMANSGKILDFSDLGIVIDKHSTGGVGDKITLILMPLIASFGIIVAKMSGRGLGITGGTVDKLESIPNYNTQISIDEFKENVKRIGISLMGQTLDLAPADKKIYALRDTINCTESIPLIASSIMSKKIAAGANKIVIDVTYGNGAFMKTKERALELATIMQKIGELANKETKCILTDMNQPLGYSVGNSLEVIEAVRFLKNEVLPKDVLEVVVEIGSYILIMAKKAKTKQEAEEMILENIKNQKAYQKFEELISNQLGDVSYIKNIEKFEKAEFIEPIIAKKDGKITELNAYKVGELTVYLGGGRQKKDDLIDYRVGFVFSKKVGDIVKKGEILGYIHSSSKDKLEYVQNQEIFKIV